jgi:hypothetical protein
MRLLGAAIGAVRRIVRLLRLRACCLVIIPAVVLGSCEMRLSGFIVMFDYLLVIVTCMSKSFY